MNNYRIDRVQKVVPGQDYKTPCGMNTIVLIQDRPINPFSVAKSLPKLPENEIYIVSVWNENLRNYEVKLVIGQKNEHR